MGNTGIDVDVSNSQLATGILVKSNTSGQQAIGLNARASDASILNVGVAGIATGNGCSTRAFGVYGHAYGPCSTPTVVSAGYFAGSVVVNGDPLGISDESVKQNIEPLSNQTEQLMKLEPVSYDFKCEDYPHMGLSQKHSCGLIAQDVQEVFPDFVSSVYHPGAIDEETQEFSQGEELLAINYTELIPVLIKVTQEQQETINSMHSTIEELSAMISECCSDEQRNMEAGSDNNAMQAIDIQLTDGYGNILYQNIPNPFQDKTTLIFELAHEAWAELRVMDEKGSLVEVLFNQKAISGQHSVQWDSSTYTSGVYYYALFVNGMKQVERMVKL